MLSRVIQPETGAEQFRFAIGQRLYFDSQQVGFPGVSNRTDRRSDILLAASGDLGRGVSFDSGVQISLGNTQVPRFSLAWRYWPDRERIFNFGVRYQRAELGQVDTSFQWPLGRHWTALGRINYSWLDQAINSQGVLENTRPGVIESVIGAQYSADCWQARFVVQRFVTAATERTTAFFLQLELNGLGRVGTDPFAILRRNIPGFQAPGDNLNRQDKFSVYQ
jgi:LPS-assembly protein